MVVNPMDRFADSYYSTVNDIMWSGRNLQWIYFETLNFWTFWMYFYYGFFDKGDSWEKGHAILKHNGFERWLSPETMRLFPDFEYYML